MIQPEATIRLLRKRVWGANAMQRRVIRCCADNPECLYQDECITLYDTFVNMTDDNRKEIYHQLRDLGIGSVEARANLSATKVKKLEATGDKHGTR